MNILLTSVGRRSYLVEYFRAALNGRGVVIGANMYPDAPGMYAADISVVCPPADHPDCVPFLLEVCRKHDVRLLCSLHDLDVLMLSRHRGAFESAGIRTTLPSAKWAELCLDKYACTQVLTSAGIAVPWATIHVEEALERIAFGDLQYPLTVKARAGFGSLGLQTCQSGGQVRDAVAMARAEIQKVAALRYLPLPINEAVLIQEHVSGREVCIGVLNDFSGNYQAHFVAEVHAMRAGESDRATSLCSSSAGELPQRLAALTGHTGIWGFDCLEDESGQLRIIDINPRFSGDYPFHHLAGANVPAVLLAWLSGSAVDPSWLESKAGVRSYKDIVPRCASDAAAQKSRHE